MTCNSTITAFMLLVSALESQAFAQCEDDWFTGAPKSSVNGIVYAMTSVPTASGMDIIVGGEFELAGDCAVRNVARWDGRAWSSLGGGVSGTVYALAYHNGLVWVGGIFGEAGGRSALRIATWDGHEWSTFGKGCDGGVYAIRPHGSDVFIGGAFSYVDGWTARGIARYDGNSWLGVGNLVGDGAVRAILPVGESELYIGGSFNQSTTTILNRVARLQSGAWEPMGTGFHQGEVRHLVDWNGQILAGGTINTTGSPSVFVNGVAAWNGTSWQSMDSPTDPTVRYLGVFQDRLFLSSGDEHFLEFQEGQWVVPTTAVPMAPIFCASVANNQLWVGGQFRSTTGAETRYIARLDGADWKSVPFGTDGIIATFCHYGNALYAGGNFTVVDGLSADRIARWTGSAWEPVGAGFDSSVSVLSVYDEHLYAGGSFENAGGSPASGVAYWDGESWSPAGDGVQGTNSHHSVSSFVEHEGVLYAGGDFVRAGTVSASKIARWDRQTWTNLSAYQINGSVKTLAVWSGSLYLGGHSSISQGLHLQGVAKYRPATRNFEPLGLGISGTVDRLLTSEGGLIAGGSWSYVDGAENRNGVVRWDGAAWSDVGDIQFVRRLAFLRGQLHAAPSAGSSPGLQRYTDNGDWEYVPQADPDWRNSGLFSLIEFNNEVWASGTFARADSPLVASYARLASRTGPTDLNGDRRVDVLDLAILLARFGESDIPAWTPGDLDDDGDIDLQDLAEMLAAFGIECG